MVVVLKPGVAVNRQAPEESFEDLVLRRYDVGLKVEVIAKDMSTTATVVRGILLKFERIQPAVPRADTYRWDNTFLEDAKGWWAAGAKSAQEIAGFDPKGGLTSNMVLAKMRQLGIQCGRPPRARAAVKIDRPHKLTAPPITARRGGCIGNGTKAKPFVSPVDTVLEPLEPIGDFPPENTCQWSYGDPGRDPDWRMCGRERPRGKPYCDAHAARAFDTAATRRLQALQG